MKVVCDPHTSWDILTLAQSGMLCQVNCSSHLNLQCQLYIASSVETLLSVSDAKGYTVRLDLPPRAVTNTDF